MDNGLRLGNLHARQEEQVQPSCTCTCINQAASTCCLATGPSNSTVESHVRLCVAGKGQVYVLLLVAGCELILAAGRQKLTCAVPTN